MIWNKVSLLSICFGSFYFVFLGVNCTGTPCSGLRMTSAIGSKSSVFDRDFISNFLNKLASTTFSSIKANRCPMQLRLPAENGM